MAIKKIVFISGSPVSVITESRFNILWYKENGYEVELWDLSLIYHTKGNIDYYFSGSKDFEFKKISPNRINCKLKCDNYLKKLKEDVIVCLIDFNNNDNFWLRRLFKKYNILYYVGPVAPTYLVSVKEELHNRFALLVLFHKLYKSFKYGDFFRKLFRKFKNLIYKYTNYYKKPLFLVSSGRIGREEWMRITQAESFISILSCDLLWEKNKRIINENYGVFIDDTMYFSPDKNMNPNFKSEVRCTDLKVYQKNLDNVFDIIEKNLNLKIVIAASGKFEYSKNHPYSDRKVFYRNTNNLLQHSSIAITHSSIVALQTIFTNQPVIFLTDETIVNEKERGIFMMAELMGKQVINAKNFDSKILNEIMKPMKINQSLINDYFIEGDIKDFIKPHQRAIDIKIKSIK